MRRKVTIIAFVAVLAVVMSAALSFAGITEVVSVDSSGTIVNNGGSWPSISFDGRHVAFSSSGLDSNCPGHGIFVHDRQTDITECVSIDNSGNPANNGEFHPQISGNGQVVAFYTSATNLDPACAVGNWQTYVRDIKSGVTECVSVNSSGEVANWWTGFIDSIAIDYEGRYVVFLTQASNLVPDDTNGVADIFVRDRLKGTTERVSVDSNGNQQNGHSQLYPSISGNGKYVVFGSRATNLISNDTNGAIADVFIHDRDTGETVLVSVDSNGNQANADCGDPVISDDGMYIAFVSEADNIVPDDTNGTSDIFLHNRYKGETVLVSVDANGNQFARSSVYPSISADGRYVAFMLWGPYYNSVWVYDALTGTSQLASVNSEGLPANHHSLDPEISGDGKVVAFQSRANNLDPPTTIGVYVHELGTANTPPTADAGADVTAECAGPEGATVMLDGSASTDPDGDVLSYTWTGTFGTATGETATVTLPLGTHTVTLTVDDGNGGTATDEVVITVADTTPPVITIFGIADGEIYALGLVPEAGYDVMDTCSGVASSSALLVGGEDVCSDSFTYNVTATDNAGNEGTETATYEVIATAEGLLAVIHQMVLDGLVAPQMENSLVSQVQNGAFKAFINHVGAQSGKKIDPAAAAMLINAGGCLINN